MKIQQDSVVGDITITVAGQELRVSSVELRSSSAAPVVIMGPNNLKLYTGLGVGLGVGLILVVVIAMVLAVVLYIYRRLVISIAIGLCVCERS